jgi:hypothetical protein
MSDFALSATSNQLAQATKEVVRVGFKTIAREGVYPQLLGWLSTSTALLRPKQSLIDGLNLGAVLEGTWTSQFMTNFLGRQHPTMQQELLATDSGQKLVTYITAYAAAATPKSVRELMRDHLAVTMGLSQVSEIPEAVYHTCVHSPTLQLIQEDVAYNLERCHIAFSSIDTGKSKTASYRDLVLISRAFASAQHKGPNYWVRVKNLTGVESLCASLAVAFNALVKVKDINAVTPNSGNFIEGTFPSKNSTAVAYLGANPSSDEPRSAATYFTLIHFDYDSSGTASIGICDTGGPINDYIIPDSKGKLSSSSKLIAELEALAKLHVKGYNLPRTSICAITANILQTLAAQLAQALDEYKPGTRSVMTHIAHMWMETFLKHIDETDEVNLSDGLQEMQKLLAIRGQNDDLGSVFLKNIEPITGPGLEKLLNDISLRQYIEDQLIFSLFRVLFGRSYAGLEIDLVNLGQFMWLTDFHGLVAEVLYLLTAYRVPVAAHRKFSICCSIVQGGGYVLMPRILAEETISEIDSSLFIMVPGRLAKNDLPVQGFYYDEWHEYMEMNDIKTPTRLPSDASANSSIEFQYEEAEYGYKFWTIEAGFRLHLDDLIQGLLFMHTINDDYEDLSAATTWQCATPQHTPVQNQKTIYLSFRNVAGRRLSLSQVGPFRRSAVVHFGLDHRRALGYAENHNCDVIIL